MAFSCVSHLLTVNSYSAHHVKYKSPCPTVGRTGLVLLRAAPSTKKMRNCTEHVAEYFCSSFSSDVCQMVLTLTTLNGLTLTTIFTVSFLSKCVYIFKPLPWREICIGFWVASKLSDVSFEGAESRWGNDLRKCPSCPMQWTEVQAGKFRRSFLQLALGII